MKKCDATVGCRGVTWGKEKSKNPFKIVGGYFKRNYVGLLLVSPVLLGILFFTLAPMITSFYNSFFKFDGIDRVWNNFKNFARPFTDDDEWKEFSKTLIVTFGYSLINIPLTMILSYALAMFLNKKIKGIKVFRVLYYLPVVIPTVIYGLLWRNFTDVQYGLGNQILSMFNLGPYPFFTAESSAMPTLIFLNLFGLGGGMVLWIAALNNIPKELYEAADIEGAGFFTKTFKITIPMSSPMIFYNLIMGIIGSLQTFGNVFVLTGGRPGPNNALYFIVMKIYNAAFNSWPSEMGYASALSWMLFAIIGGLTVIVFRSSKWVFYGEDV